MCLLSIAEHECTYDTSSREKDKCPFYYTCSNGLCTDECFEKTHLSSAGQLQTCRRNVSGNYYFNFILTMTDLQLFVIKNVFQITAPKMDTAGMISFATFQTCSAKMSAKNVGSVRPAWQIITLAGAFVTPDSMATLSMVASRKLVGKIKLKTIVR